MGASSAEGHDHLLECGVAGTFAKSVDRAFDLPRTGLNSGERVRNCKAEVIVAMRRDRDGEASDDVCPDAADQCEVFVRRGVAHGVGDIDRRGAGIDRRSQHVVEEGHIAA